MINILNPIVQLLDSIQVIDDRDNDFVKMYREHINIFQSRIIKDEIEISGCQAATGLFKWIGERMI